MIVTTTTTTTTTTTATTTTIIIIIIAFKGGIWDCLHSPHCAANHLQHVRSITVSNTYARKPSPARTLANRLQHVRSRTVSKTYAREPSPTRTLANRLQNVRSRTVSKTYAREPSPTRTLKWPGCNRVQITCNTSSVYHVQHAVCHVARRDSSTIKFDRVEIAFILALFYWLKPLTGEGWEETGLPG